MISFILSIILDAILLVSITLVLLYSPYTKVEESFNLHAIYDSINFGLDDLTMFDHFQFPGAVKRSCFGSLLISVPLTYLDKSMAKFSNFLCSLKSYLADDPYLNSELCESTNLNQLLIARFLLGLYVFASLIYFKNSFSSVTYIKTSSLSLKWQLLTYSLPHLVYYSSRTLPNIFALPLVLVGFGLFIKGNIPRSLMLLSFTGMILRFEILVFTFILSSLSVMNKLMNIRMILINVSIGLFLGGFISFKLDSYFWSTSTIPEIESFIFNIIENKSVEWGTEPIWSYLTKYLPKLFLTNGGLIPLGSLLYLLQALKSNEKRRAINRVNYDIETINILNYACIVFIVFLSLNPHKEWRFLIYTIPIFSLQSASYFDYLVSGGSWRLKVFVYSLLGLTYLFGLFNLSLFTYISSLNYAPAAVLQRLNLRLLTSGLSLNNTVVHLDTGSCVNGVSLFCQLKQPLMEKYLIQYDKTENLLSAVNGSEVIEKFTYWLQYKNDVLPVLSNGCQWTLVDVGYGYDGIDFTYFNTNNILNILKMLKTSILTQRWRWTLDLLDQIVKKDVVSRAWEQNCATI